MIIAIDGPAASGKSTVARSLAARLCAGYLDTGAMYRSVAAEALRRDVSLDDTTALVELASSLTLRFEREGGSVLPTRVLADGRDVTSEIRTPEVDSAVSPVSAVPGVRQAMVRIQRELGAVGDWVVEGRDIGTVVFPDAAIKVFLTASAEERGRRREIDMRRQGLSMGAQDVQQRIEARDEYDTTREASPLVAADDAVRLDTTGLSADDVVDRIAALVEAVRR
ncbi:MAG: (d)CMP kinase [Coriobacteriia bacterium]|nr:(d)CMP kinase [Coriobacteriia bacterium]